MVTDPWFNSSELSHKHCLCEEQCALVHWDICHPIPLLRENERWVHSLHLHPFCLSLHGLRDHGCQGGSRLTRKLQKHNEFTAGTAVVQMESCGCPIPENVEGQVGWGCEQRGLVAFVPAYGREV